MDEMKLTRRQIQVLQARIDFGKNRKAAAALGITYNTYKHHIETILRKIGNDRIYNVTGAVAYAWHKRWVW